MADELDDTIRQNAQGPAKAAGDAGSVEQHSLPDQIEAACERFAGPWFLKTGRTRSKLDVSG
jgi:hypothetical protein